MKVTIYAAALLSLISLGSCASYKYMHLNGPQTAKVPGSTVSTYTRYSQIEPQVKDIVPTGKIIYKARNEEKLWNKVRNIAGRHGSNSVYMGPNVYNKDTFLTRGVIYTFNKKPQ